MLRVSLQNFPFLEINSSSFIKYEMFLTFETPAKGNLGLAFLAHHQVLDNADYKP
jgi:hypothetical protein